MVCVAKGPNHGPAPIPKKENGYVKEIKDISGLTWWGWCVHNRGACKLTLNVKNGIIEALVETIGCSGMTHSAAMASEVLPGKTLLEALNTDLVCDAITQLWRLFFEWFTEELKVFQKWTTSRAGLEDLGKGLRSQVGTMLETKVKGTRYLEMAEGYVTKLV